MRVRRQQVADHLREVPLFSDCTRSELRILARQFEETEVSAGEVLCREGDDADDFYVVVSGEATVSQNVGGTSKKVGTLGPGSCFGELALLDPAPRNATVAADGPLVIAILGKRAFRTVLRDVPALTDRLLAVLARRVRELSEPVIDETQPFRSGSDS